MSVLYITEFANSGNSNSGAQLPVGSLPAVAEQAVTFTTSSVQSAVFNENTKFIRVHADGDAFILSGENPTSTTGSMKLAADSTEYFAIRKGHRLAVIGIA